MAFEASGAWIDSGEDSEVVDIVLGGTGGVHVQGVELAEAFDEVSMFFEIFDSLLGAFVRVCLCSFHCLCPFSYLINLPLFY